MSKTTKPDPDKLWRVYWEIDVLAPSALAAARKAKLRQLKLHGADVYLVGASPEVIYLPLK